MKTSRFLLLVAGTAIAALSTNDRVRAAEQGPALSLSAVAVGPDDPAGPEKTRTGSVTIVIERWSAEREAGASQVGGARVGFIQTGSRVVAEIQYAREELDKETKGRRVVITTDRPMSSWDVATQADTAKPADTVPVEPTTFDLRLSRYGTGEGRLVTGASDSVSTEDYSRRPLRFTAVSIDRKDSSQRQ